MALKFQKLCSHTRCILVSAQLFYIRYPRCQHRKPLSQSLSHHQGPFAPRCLRAMFPRANKIAENAQEPALSVLKIQQQERGVACTQRECSHAGFYVYLAATHTSECDTSRSLSLSRPYHFYPHAAFFYYMGACVSSSSTFACGMTLA